jgi:hypothetical protein
MKPTKKQLKEIEAIEKKVSEVCDAKKTTEVTRNDDGVIINKETGLPHFLELLEKNNQPRDIEISLSFGQSSPSLKKQLKMQGYELSKQSIENAELIRQDLLALRKAGILKEKELIKCLQRLSKKISKRIVELHLKDGEEAIHKSTKLVK